MELANQLKPPAQDLLIEQHFAKHLAKFAAHYHPLFKHAFAAAKVKAWPSKKAEAFRYTDLTR